MNPLNTANRLTNTIMNKLLFCTLFCLSLSCFTYAQTSTSNLEKEEFSFFKDETSNFYYIDFESIDINLNEIVVKDNEGNVVLEEPVNDLPVDTIFELDFSQYQNGQYVVELHSYTAVLRKPFSLEK